ncbi:unnamed protein product [Spirodela intermedia]|uniref:Uncharacterized protein n=1 Tax=Spirodela intermedia TaxID=51605 RepID=A0A7I8LA02_SPIIN|nr:unnamed protein product [Spirodela intermedia]
MWRSLNRSKGGFCVSSGGESEEDRRGYSAAAAVARKVEEKALASPKGKSMSSAAAADSPATATVPALSSSWVPDPATGYYRPANGAPEVDAADLRRRLLSRRRA